MTYHFEVLCEVAEATVTEGGFGLCEDVFTARDLGEALHFAMPYLPPSDRYPRPLRRGAVAGQVLRELRRRGVVRRCGHGRWALSWDPYDSAFSDPRGRVVSV